MLILVTNDDGIQAPGLKALTRSLQALGRVVVIAPDRERSASGHAMTLHSPLRAEEIAPDWFAVDGTPTDCVNLGVHGLLERRPDLVVSGINRGANLGDDITYSGTVAAAMEATIMGVASLAISQEYGPDSFPLDYQASARVAANLARQLMDNGLPPDTFLNVNVPDLDFEQLAGIRLTRQGKRVYGDLVIEKLDPRGRKYYWLGGGELGYKPDERSDFYAIEAGFVSVTPLHLDLTNYASFDAMNRWNITLSDLG